MQQQQQQQQQLSKLQQILKSEVTSSIFYILVGLCLIVAPEQTVNIICKIIFGVLLIAAGAYHIIIYIMGRESSTVVDMLSGVLVLVIGGFLFSNPEVVRNLLPIMLGAMVAVDSAWAIKAAMRLRKEQNELWKVILILSLVFIGLGIFIIFNPFKEERQMILFSGIVFLANGVIDLIFLYLLKKGIKWEKKEKPPVPPVPPVQFNTDASTQEFGGASGFTPQEQAPAPSQEGPAPSGETVDIPPAGTSSFDSGSSSEWKN